jgi:hypothetical protein
MVAFKKVPAAFAKIAILISCAILVSAPAAALSSRIPSTLEHKFEDVKEWCFLYKFDTYAEAVAAIEDWNDNYSETYLVALTAWNGECADIASKIEAAVEYRSLGKAVVASPDERYLRTTGVGTVWVEHDRETAWAVLEGQQETTPWLEREVEVVERILPACEFPEAPDPGEPYYKALSAYCQIRTDGLDEYEWTVLRFALYDTKRFRRSGFPPAYFTNADERLRNLVAEGYITLGPHEKNVWDRISGNLPAKLDLGFTAEGKKFLHKLVDRCWDFRESSAKEAYARGRITAAEFERLQKDNQCIREYFHEQIEKTREWREYPGQSPYKLEVALKSFYEAGEDLLTAPCPYERLIECIPKYNPAPRPVEPDIIPAGTYVRDARGVLRAVDLD